MNRQVLFIGYDIAIQEEIGEFLKGLGGRAWFADDADRSIRILDENDISTVVLNMHTIGDAGILKFINQYYPDIKVLVAAGHEFEDIIHALSKGHFSILPSPFRLKELGKML